MEDFFKIAAFGSFFCIVLSLAFLMTGVEVQEREPDDREGAARMKTVAWCFFGGFVLLLAAAIVLHNMI